MEITQFSDARFRFLDRLHSPDLHMDRFLRLGGDADVGGRARRRADWFVAKGASPCPEARETPHDLKIVPIPTCYQRPTPRDRGRAQKIELGRVPGCRSYQSLRNPSAFN